MRETDFSDITVEVKTIVVFDLINVFRRKHNPLSGHVVKPVRAAFGLVELCR